MNWKTRGRGKGKQRGTHFRSKPKARSKLSGVELENLIADQFRKRGYTVFVRRNFCDVLAVRGSMAYLVECKDHKLTRKSQRDAVKELSRNEKFARELLEVNKLKPDKIEKVLVARRFDHQSKRVRQYTPGEFVAYLVSKTIYENDALLQGKFPKE